MDPNELTNCTCFNLRKATRVLTQIYDDALQPIGLGANQIALLTIVKQMGPVGMNDLASALVMDRTTLTRNLKPLIIAGYLNSSEGEDRRRRMISLTPAGDNIHKKAVPIWQEIQTQVTDALGQERWTRLLGDLHRVTRLA